MVAPRAPYSYRGWLEVSSLSGEDKRALTRPLEGAERRDYNPTWSPDGSRVAFARWTPKELALMVVKGDGSGLHRVAEIGRRTRASGTHVEIEDIHWSPDGRSLAFLVLRLGAPVEGGPPTGIYVSNAAGSGQRLTAALPKKPYGYFSLFGWTNDGRRVTHAFSRGEPLFFEYEGPAQLKTTSSDGLEPKTLVTEDAITDASWSPDGSLAYVRHCAGIPCQLAVLDPTSGLSRPLTHFRYSPDGWDELPLARRPPSSDIVYTHGRTVYEVSPTTKKTRTVRTLPCPRKRCLPFQDEISIAGITTDGRFALIEVSDYPGLSEIRRDYRLELDTGALTRIHLATADPAEIYLP